MEIRFDPDGTLSPDNQTHLIVREVHEDGRVLRHFLCLRCRELLVAEDGKGMVHSCDGPQDQSQ